MKEINQFNDNGDFVLWIDDIGRGYTRTSYIPAKTCGALYRHMVVEEKPYSTFSRHQVTRPQAAQILYHWNQL